MPKSTPTKWLCPIGDNSDYEDYADEDYESEFINLGKKLLNPQNCPMPKKGQKLGNQCLGHQKRVLCCGKNFPSTVRCMPKNTPNDKLCPFGAEDYDYEDYAVEDYDYEDYDEVADANEEE